MEGKGRKERIDFRLLDEIQQKAMTDIVQSCPLTNMKSVYNVYTKLETKTSIDGDYTAFTK